jgi:prepilin-type N-terminal cleavage/methylation domain-containing protein
MIEISATLSRRIRTRGFTIIELMVVCAVIAILVAIIMPAVGKARDQARELVCQSNQRQIATAFLAFAADHKGRLPGNWWDYANPDPQKRAWLLNYGEPITNAPSHGTVYKYLSKNDAVYRCPTTDLLGVGAGAGSNGRFDYASFLVFSGARPADLLAGTARFTYPDGHIEENLPIPLICEEDPQGNNAGGINGGNNEGGHCSSDRLAHNHRGGSYYIAVDGSSFFFKEPLNSDSRNWSAKSYKGVWVSLGAVPNPSWAWWDSQ